jgi:hypothetical protein
MPPVLQFSLYEEFLVQTSYWLNLACIDYLLSCSLTTCRYWVVCLIELFSVEKAVGALKMVTMKKTSFLD